MPTKYSIIKGSEGRDHYGFTSATVIESGYNVWTKWFANMR